MIIWLNGTFGAGKTTTGALLTQKSHKLRSFDPESVGYMLRPNLTDHPVSDFRHWESWRVLIPIVADELIRFSGQSLVAAQTVLEENYWDELEAGLSERGHEVFHVLLEAEESSLRGRIEADQAEVAAKHWRLDHIAKFAMARPWLAARADLCLDTTHLTQRQAAERIWDVAAPRLKQASSNTTHVPR